ncbi:MAG: anti-sigma factor antagonist [Chromatiaceae bacterium]|nr:MAG: anti-sigma factor antagonist [Chromatiaceae bacterium]
MPIHSIQHDNGQTLVIQVRGRFDFSLHKEFRQAYKNSEGASRYVVDLMGTEYVDSSALGMLLLLREFASDHGGEVVLRSGPGEVRKILEIANFPRIFRIEDGAATTGTS